LATCSAAPAFRTSYEAIFGGVSMGSRGAGRATARGRDLEHEVEITLESAFSGTQLMLEMDGRKLEVKIPEGVKTGSRVRVAGRGAAWGGRGGRGDLYLRIKVMPHPTFERRATIFTARSRWISSPPCWREARVPTLSGPVALRIPEGHRLVEYFA